MTTVLPSFDSHFKQVLEKASPQFAWSVMLLQISLEQQQEPCMEEVMQLMQLYMIGVGILENQKDCRYTYFKDKISSLMSRRAVVEQLQRASTNQTPEQQTQETVERKRLENMKQEHEMQLQIHLQKDLLTLDTIKDIIKKQQQHSNTKLLTINQTLIGQHKELEQRIKQRMMRSISGKKFNHELLVGPSTARSRHNTKSTMEVEKKPETLKVVSIKNSAQRKEKT